MSCICHVMSWYISLICHVLLYYYIDMEIINPKSKSRMNWPLTPDPPNFPLCTVTYMQFRLCPCQSWFSGTTKYSFLAPGGHEHLTPTGSVYSQTSTQLFCSLPGILAALARLSEAVRHRRRFILCSGQAANDSHHTLRYIYTPLKALEYIMACGWIRWKSKIDNKFSELLTSSNSRSHNQ